MLEPVTLDQLRILMAIAETGSFSAAARRLSRAQSAISHAVEGLETALGVALFDRTGRARKLTEAGRILLEDAKAVVSRTEELRARARSMGQGIEPELSLAVDVMFPTDVVIESIRALQLRLPLAAGHFAYGGYRCGRSAGARRNRTARHQPRDRAPAQ